MIFLFAEMNWAYKCEHEDVFFLNNDCISVIWVKSFKFRIDIRIVNKAKFI